MDIVSNLPFEVRFFVNHREGDQKRVIKEITIDNWVENYNDLSALERIESIEEFDELDLYFNSVFSDAKFYFDALECCPVDPRIDVDDKGAVYCTASEEKMVLYESNSNEFDALRVDRLPLVVNCNDKNYYTYLDVIPKQLSGDEWNMMREDLENEIKGLSQDIVRRSIGFGSSETGWIPPDDLYSFLVINKYSKAVVGALIDLKDKPKYKIVKNYEEVNESKAKLIDNQTVKQYLKKGNKNDLLVVPKREIVYDIQENRLLKKILKVYENKLDRFIEIVNNSLKYHKQELSKKFGSKAYEANFIKVLEEYYENAKKLKKVSSIVKEQDWFNSVSNLTDAYVPHSFALDARYGTMYRMYTDLNRKEFEITFDPKYAYSWKKSSELYEIWCYIKVCRELLKNYELADSDIKNIFINNQVVPFIEKNTCIKMENENSIIEVIYNRVLPKSSLQAERWDFPFFVIGKHNNPDICINLYQKETGFYVASYIIECKYRKLNSFWTSKTRNSREQIIAYENDSKSKKILDGKYNVFDPRPVKKVLVFTPDVIREQEHSDEGVILTTFKPEENNAFAEEKIEKLYEMIKKEIAVAKEML